MKEYEVIIERSQPTCGGKAPKDVKVLTVSCEDPVAYVRELEKAGELEAATNENGEIVIELGCGAKQIRYTFSEV